MSAKKTILVVEDEESIRKLVTRLLSDGGYEVLTACDGAEAVCVYDAHAENIDLTLMDVMMPKMTGQTAMEHILEKHPQARFLFSSGFHETALMSDTVLKRGFPLIKKPFSKVKLLEAVSLALNGPRAEGDS